MTTTTRGVKEGIGFGIIAGILFAIAEVFAAVGMGEPAAMPFRMFASIVLGQAALMEVSAGAAFAIGGLVHLVLSGIFGLVYGLASSRLSAETRANLTRQAGIGLAFGLALWLVNFQLIARLLYPWFLGTPQALQALLHAIFFGLPLGLLYGAAERRLERPRRQVAQPA
jgi:hypothetical protein